MTKQEEIVNAIKVLRKEVEILTTRLKPNGTGHLHTAIGVINGRIDELIGKAIDGQPDEIRDLTSEIYGEDVYDEYDEYAQQTKVRKARLRNIQADDMSDDYEHTKEYFDRNRNRAMEGEDLPKREMTVSEQMQAELEPLPEPLPINTFK